MSTNSSSNFSFRCAKEVALLKPTTLKITGGLMAVEKDLPEIGLVVGLGDGEKTIKDLKIGDTVFYRKFGEFRFYIESEEYLFVKFEDLLGAYNE